MTDPIFILGCHRSGTSVVAGLLHDACGVAMGELMPATIDNPMGYYEAEGVVDAHRSLLFQMERDWTCPPSSFRPGSLDLDELREQLAIHRALDGVWAVKDPRTMFLLRAWAHLGLERARLIAVVREPADTIRSIERRDGIREDRAEAIVDAYLWRLAELAKAIDLPVVRFSSDGAEVLRQVRELAASLELEWDQEAAESFFDPQLVRHRSPLTDSSPVHDRLIERAFDYQGRTVPSVSLASLGLRSAPEWPLETHLGVRYAQQRHELWDVATFATTPNPVVAELVLEGARSGGGHRPGVSSLHQIEISSPITAGAQLMRRNLRPDGVIAHGVLANRTRSEIEFFFRSLYVSTHAFAEIVVDVPAPHGPALQHTEPAHPVTPRPDTVLEIATASGWDHITSQRVSVGRVGIVFRKRLLVDRELIPVVTDLMAAVDRIHAIDRELGRLTRPLGDGNEPSILEGGVAGARQQRDEPTASGEAKALRRRAETAERDLARLRSRRSVRLALAASRPFGRVFRLVRRWKNVR